MMATVKIQQQEEVTRPKGTKGENHWNNDHKGGATVTWKVVATTTLNMTTLNTTTTSHMMNQNTMRPTVDENDNIHKCQHKSRRSRLHSFSTLVIFFSRSSSWAFLDVPIRRKSFSVVAACDNGSRLSPSPHSGHLLQCQDIVNDFQVDHLLLTTSAVVMNMYGAATAAGFRQMWVHTVRQVQEFLPILQHTSPRQTKRVFPSTITNNLHMMKL